MTLAARFAAFKDPLAAFTAGANAAWAQINKRRLIWTTEGHKFADELTNDVQWVVHEGGKGIDFIDRWVDATGREVSRAVHVYNQAGAVSTASAAGTVNEPTTPPPAATETGAAP